MRSIVTAGMLMASLSLPAADVVPFSAAQRSALGIEVASVIVIETGASARLPAQVAVPNAQLHVITAPLDGLIETLLVGEGERLTVGQPLAHLQSSRLLELQGDYLETHTRFDLARTDYLRDQKLYQEGIVAERRLLESKASYGELASSLSRVRRLLELAGMDEVAVTQLGKEGNLSGKLTIRAPSDGVILQQMVDVGERVAASDPLYKLGKLKPLWVEIHVPLDQASVLELEQQVQIPDLGLSGRIVAIGQQVHGMDQGVLVRAEISEGAERLRPGQFVQAQLEADAGGSLRVSRSALFRSDGKAYLFIEQPGGFRPVEVQVLHEEPAHLVIRADIAADSQVVVTGIAALKAVWLGGGE